VTPWQCRAAREVLGWTIRKLSEVSCISYDTIARFERGSAILPDSATALRGVLVNAGAYFLEDGGISILSCPGYGVIRIYREDGDAEAK